LPLGPKQFANPADEADVIDLLQATAMWGGLLADAVACFLLGRKLARMTDEGRMNRFVAILLYGVAAVHLTIIPVLAIYCARLAGLFAARGDDGVIVGAGFMGGLIGVVAAGLFVVVMLWQRLRA
jgi:hypothetical protein